MIFINPISRDQDQFRLLVSNKKRAPADTAATWDQNGILKQMNNLLY